MTAPHAGAGGTAGAPQDPAGRCCGRRAGGPRRADRRAGQPVRARSRPGGPARRRACGAGRDAGQPGHHVVPPGGSRAVPGGPAGARLRRQQGRRDGGREDLARHGYLALDLHRARVRGQRRADPPRRPGVRGGGRRRGCSTCSRPGPTCCLDRPGDPRVGVVGGSYGGALALHAGRHRPAGRRGRPADHLERPGHALFPQSATTAGCRPPRRASTAGPAAGGVQAGLGRRVLQQRCGGRPAGRAGGSTRPSARPTRRAPARGRRPGAARPDGRVQPGGGARPRTRADAARAGAGGLAVPARPGRRQRCGDRADRHAGQGGLVRRRPRRRRARRPAGCAPSPAAGWTAGCGTAGPPAGAAFSASTVTPSQRRQPRHRRRPDGRRAAGRDDGRTARPHPRRPRGAGAGHRRPAGWQPRRGHRAARARDARRPRRRAPRPRPASRPSSARAPVPRRPGWSARPPWTSPSRRARPTPCCSPGCTTTRAAAGRPSCPSSWSRRCGSTLPAGGTTGARRAARGRPRRSRPATGCAWSCDDRPGVRAAGRRPDVHRRAAPGAALLAAGRAHPAVGGRCATPPLSARWPPRAAAGRGTAASPAAAAVRGAAAATPRSPGAAGRPGPRQGLRATATAPSTRPVVPGRAGQVLGLLGPERRGQDDHAAHAHGPDHPDRRVGSDRLRPTRRGRARRCCRGSARSSRDRASCRT